MARVCARYYIISSRYTGTNCAAVLILVLVLMVLELILYSA